MRKDEEVYQRDYKDLSPYGTGSKGFQNTRPSNSISDQYNTPQQKFMGYQERPNYQSQQQAINSGKQQSYI